MFYWTLFSLLERILKVWKYKLLLYFSQAHFEPGGQFYILWVAEKHDVKVSVNDIVIKAVAVALRNVPEANGKALSMYLLIQ